MKQTWIVTNAAVPLKYTVKWRVVISFTVDSWQLNKLAGCYIRFIGALFTLINLFLAVDG